MLEFTDDQPVFREVAASDCNRRGGTHRRMKNRPGNPMVGSVELLEKLFDLNRRQLGQRGDDTLFAHADLIFQIGDLLLQDISDGAPLGVSEEIASWEFESELK